MILPGPATAPVSGAAIEPLPTTRLYRDASALVLSSMVAAGTGMAFWAVAARLISPERLGVQTALFAVISGPALVIAAGIGDALNAIIPSNPGAEADVVRAGYRLAFGYGVPVAAIAAVASMTALPAVRGSWLAGGSVFLGVMVWTMFAIQDSVLTSVGRARWLPVENGLAGLAKLAILPFVASALLCVVWSALAPAIVAVAVLVPVISRLSVHTPRAGVEHLSIAATRRLKRLTRRTTASVALTLGALAVVPFLVTAIGGAEQGSVFSLSLSMTSVLDFITSGLGVSLVVHASSKREHEWTLVRAALVRTIALVTVGAIVLSLLSPWVYRALNPHYLDLHGVAVVAVLAGGSVLRTVYLIWASLQQSRQQLRFLLALNAVAAVAAYVLLVVLVPDHGALAAAWTVTGTQLFLSIGAVTHLTMSWRAESAARGIQARDAGEMAG